MPSVYSERENHMNPNGGRLGKSDDTTAFGQSANSSALEQEQKWDDLFVGTPYEDQYRLIMDKYSNGPAKTFFGIFGKNAQRAYDHQQAMLTELQNLQQQQYSEEFESPTAQAARQRAAGINPDLAGLSTQESGGFGYSPASTGSPAGADAGSLAGAAFSGISGLLGYGLQAQKQADDFKTSDVQRTWQELQNDASGFNTASHIITGSLADYLKDNPGANTSDFFGNDQFYNDNLALMPTVGSKSQNKLLARSFKRAWNDVQRSYGQAYDILNAHGESASKFAEILADPTKGFDVKIAAAKQQPILEAMYELNILKPKFDALVIDIKTRYANTIDPEQAAAAQNAIFSATRTQSEYNEEYYENLDPELMARWDALEKEYNAIVTRAKSTEWTYLEALMNTANTAAEREAVFELMRSNYSLSGKEYLAYRGVLLGIDKFTDPENPVFQVPEVPGTEPGTPAKDAASAQMADYFEWKKQNPHKNELEYFQQHK